MPVNTALKSLARDGRFSLDDAKKLKDLVAKGQVTQEEAKEALTRYGDVMDPEAGQLMEQFTGGSRGQSMSSLPEGMANRPMAFGAKGDDVKALQRGLMALGMKEQDASMTMPTGVDGRFGNDTKAAVSAFQTAHGITPTGKADAATLKAIDKALRADAPSPSQPPVVGPSGGQPPRPTRGLNNPPATTTTEATTTPAGPKPGTPEAMVTAAQKLVDGPTAANYGVHERWINNDPRHAAPTNKPINGTGDKWKCNLFAGNTLAAAGFEPPYYNNVRSGGEYPNANQLYKWSDKYAAKFGNQPRFQLADEMRNMPAMNADDRQARMTELMSKLKPGDLLIVGHNTTDIADGGHCRVFLGMDEDGKFKFAQAGNDAAVVKSQTIDDIIGEKDAWILRPNVTRK